MNRIHKNKSWREYKWLVFGLFLLAIGLPFYIYLVSYKSWGFDLTDKGAIGDAIGGITAPVIGLIGAMLVYLSFRSQVRANELLSNQTEFRLFSDLILELKKDINFIYDRKNWDLNHKATPYLAYLRNGEIKSVPSLFKRRLMFVFKDYMFISTSIYTSEKLTENDKVALVNTMDNIYEFFLDNYCKAFSQMYLTGKNAKLSESLQGLSINIMSVLQARQSPTLDDEEFTID